MTTTAQSTSTPQGLLRYGHTYQMFEKRNALMFSLYGIELRK